MESDILKKLEEQDRKIQAIYVSVEKTRKYFLWTFIITIIVFVLPLIIMAFAIPTLMSTYTSALEGLSF